MRIALYQPDIPQNTGAILRLAACLDIPVDIIGPAVFDTSNRALRRAGLDYLSTVEIGRHVGWQAFQDWLRSRAPAQRLVLLTTRGLQRHDEFTYQRTDVLLVGRESAGVPDYVHDAADARVRIPLRAGMRSLNVAIATAIVVGEACRQLQAWPTG